MLSTVSSQKQLEIYFSKFAHVSLGTECTRNVNLINIFFSLFGGPLGPKNWFILSSPILVKTFSVTVPLILHRHI